MKAVSLAIVVLLAGCANEKQGNDSLAKPDSGGGSEFDVGGGIDAVADNHLDPDAACGATTEQATVTPVNLFVMFDKSQSMGPDKTSTKWAGARKGMEAFVKDSASAGLRIALRFFPRPADATPSCSSAPYATPVVPFDVLPKNADPILAAIDAENPDGFGTPMYPALLGALNGALTEIKTRPGEAAAVLLVTDGAPEAPPTTCGSINAEDAKAIADVAATGLAFTPSIKTFVVGLPGVNVAVANQIAASGGTKSAILATDPTKIDVQFRDALALVRGEAVPCEIGLPDKVAKGEISYGLVNVTYSKGGMPPAMDLLQDPTCASGTGWRYDDASKPTKIILCASTCDTIHSDPMAKVEILLGCKTHIR